MEQPLPELSRYSHPCYIQELFGLNYISIQFSILYLMMLITTILTVLVKTKKKCKNINVNCIHDSATLLCWRLV